MIPKLLTLFIRLVFSCYCPHTAVIGRGVRLGYGGLGVVIGDETRLGDEVEVDQGVTFGGNATQEGMPMVGARCYIGAGAKVLGPVTIGEAAVVAANAVVVSDVPPATLVGGVPARVLKTDFDADERLHHRKGGRRDDLPRDGG